MITERTDIFTVKMGAELPLIVLTGFWAVIGIVLPILVQFCMRNSPNKGVIQTVLALTAACCWIFWLCTFLCQLNPLYGPQIESPVMKFIQQEWKQ